MTGELRPEVEVIRALVAAWELDPALTYDQDGETVHVHVVDGPLIEDTDARQVLLVGTATSAAPGGAQGQQRPGYGGRVTHRIDVACQLAVWSGDVDMGAVRDAGFAALQACERTLAAAPNVGGAVDWARVTRSTYQPAQTDGGAGALIDFTVQVEATRFG